MPRPHPISTGDRFGRLTALETIKSVSYPCGAIGTMRECRCDCGTVKFFATGSLRTGNAKSCGCLSSELKSARSITHGYSRPLTNGTRIYRIWAGMLTRCTNPNVPIYKYYGGRGITVCERWEKFENFLVDMGEPPPGLTIDRLDNDKGYFKDNCAWRTPLEQGNNRRNTVKVTFNGLTMTLREWSEHLGVSYEMVKARYWNGWSAERMLTEPKN